MDQFGGMCPHCKVEGLSAVRCAETAKLIDLPFGLWTEAQVELHSPGGANVPSYVSTLASPGEYD